MLKVVKDFKAFFSDTRRRNIFLLTLMIALLVVVFSMIFFYRKMNTDALVNLNRAPGDIQSTPGSLNPTDEYASLQNEENVRNAQQAHASGTSAIPTLISSQSFGEGITSDQLEAGGGLYFSTLAQNEERLGGETKSLWMEDLRNTNCSQESIEEAVRQGATAEDLIEICGCDTLRENAYSADQLHGFGFDISQLRSCGFTAAELRDAGFSAAELKGAGFSAQELKDAGFSAQDLKNAGFSAQDLKNAGFTAEELRNAGFSAQELKDAGFSAQDLKDAGFDQDELAAAGFSPDELAQLDFSDGLSPDRARMLAELGCNSLELKGVGFSATELKEAGCSADELKDAGFSAQELRDAGFIPAELKQAGFSAQALKNAGFTPQELEDVGFEPHVLDNLSVGDETSDEQAGISDENSSCNPQRIRQLAQAGAGAAELRTTLNCSIDQLRQQGFLDDNLRGAGYSDDELQAVSISPETQATDVSNENSVEQDSAENNEMITDAVPSRSAADENQALLDQIMTAPRDTTSNDLQHVLEMQTEQMTEQQKQQDMQQRQSAILGQMGQLTAQWGPTAIQSYVSGNPPELGGIAGNANTASPGNIIGNANIPMIRAGDIIFAVLDTAVNSDEPGPILATIVSGEFNGSKLLGSLSQTGDGARVTLSFNMMALPDNSSTIPINAFAIDPDTARTALSSNTNRHILLRYGTLFASAFAEGVGNAFASSGTTIVQGDVGLGSAIITANRSVPENLLVGVGEVGRRLGNNLSPIFNRPPTVEVYSGTGMGILFTADVNNLR